MKVFTIFTVAVSIPFKRESLSKGRCLHIPQRPRNRCFNSLQTGKPIQRIIYCDVHLPIEDRVSIPFKRESLSKGSNQPDPRTRILRSFNSLQTGKPIQSFAKGWSHWRDRNCFNSLQTGKPIQSCSTVVIEEVIVEVSIPFKRESLSKGTKSPSQTRV